MSKVAQELALSRTYGDEQGRVEISEEARIRKIALNDNGRRPGDHATILRDRREIRGSAYWFRIKGEETERGAQGIRTVLELS